MAMAIDCQLLLLLPLLPLLLPLLLLLFYYFLVLLSLLLPQSALVAFACCMRVAINIAGAPRTSLRVECYKYLLAVYFARCRCRCRFVIFAGKYYHSARRICICQCIIHKHSHIQGCVDTSWGNEVRQIPFIVLHGDLLEGD